MDLQLSEMLTRERLRFDVITGPMVEAHRGGGYRAAELLQERPDDVDDLPLDRPAVDALRLRDRQARPRRAEARPAQTP